MSIPRPEYPRPQFERAQWMNLNGEWQFETDNTRSGISRELYRDDVGLTQKICVPFCPESALSGIGNTDFMYGVCYKRSFVLPTDWTDGVTKLHFGAVDYRCIVYLNETRVGEHVGGYVSFAFDISKYLRQGDNTVTVFAYDDTRDPMIPRGKQCERYKSSGCSYTRTTGIWQTVWLEHMPETHIASVKYYSDPDNCVLTILAKLCGAGKFSATVSYQGKQVGFACADSGGGDLTLSVKLSERHLWEVGNGRLYDIVLTYGQDSVCSYFGLRSVAMSGQKFLLNGKSVFQRLVLDQGFYPDGVYTAPTDGAFERDVRLSLACGFNGARLHEKVFEERFLYYCDKMGYLVWAEYPDWGLDHTRAESLYVILPEWVEEVTRDFNHPSIVCWCPRNETSDRDGRRQCDEAIRTLYQVTKAIDPTRPCIDVSGFYHVETDIYDVHNYDQNPESFRAAFAMLNGEGDFKDAAGAGRQVYHKDLPFHVSEYGGICWSENQEGWGYGNAPKSAEEFIERFAGLAEVLLNHPNICGFCYTQLTDVEQEQNGLYYYDRTPKFDVSRFYRVLTQKAAIEQ